MVAEHDENSQSYTELPIAPWAVFCEDLNFLHVNNFSSQVKAVCFWDVFSVSKKDSASSAV